MNRKLIKVAITGGIGSGKSTVADFFQDAGFFVIRSDLSARRIMVLDQKVKKQIINEFGSEVYFDNGDINRNLLYKKVFSDTDKLKKLNKIVHPVVIKEINDFFELFKDREIIFVESALIFEAKIEKLFDYIILITADEELKIKRTSKRDKITEEDIKSRIENQLPDEVKRKKSHFIFENNGTFEDLHSKVKLFLNLVGVKAFF